MESDLMMDWPPVSPLDAPFTFGDWYFSAIKLTGEADRRMISNALRKWTKLRVYDDGWIWGNSVCLIDVSSWRVLPFSINLGEKNIILSIIICYIFVIMKDSVFIGEKNASGRYGR